MSRSSVPDSNDRTLWLCLCLIDLPLDVFVRGADPQQVGRPVVITEQGYVCRVNPAAAELGVESGSSMSTALHISESLASFERNPDKERRTLDRLAQWAYQFTPAVSIQPPDSLLLEIGGCLKLWSGIDTLMSRIRSRVFRLGFNLTTGLGRTPLTAHLAAISNFGEGRIATPDNIGHLSVGDLSIETETIASLHNMGIRSIEQLLSLPTSSLSRRFGIHFTDYLQRLTGSKADPRKFITAVPHFSSEITFLADVTDRNALLFPIKRLLSELGEFLNGRQLCTSHLSWRLAHRSHAPTDFTVSLAEPENDSAVFLSLTQLRLETLGSVGEVDSLSLAVRSFVPANSKAGDLFHGTRYRNRDGRISSPADKAHTDALLNMLGARLGQDSCFGLAIVSDHRPEKAWARLSTSEIDSRRNNGPIEPNARPAFLLSTPKTLTTTDGIPCLGGKLSLMEGPERIDFGWWDRHDIDQPAARDYYVAREPTGALVWIFRYPADSASARWYLHGIFS